MTTTLPNDADVSFVDVRGGGHRRLPTEIAGKDAGTSPSSIRIARRLLTREASEGRKTPSESTAALQHTLARLSKTLRESIGEDGSQALYARAFAQAEQAHPALKSIRRIGEGAIHLDRVAASVETHGLAPVTAAVEAFVAELVGVLARLIGEDMVTRIVEYDPPKSRARGGAKK